MEWLADPEIWLSLLTLTTLEIVLGIDNLVFIAVLVEKLPPHQQATARRVGIALALITRLMLLSAIAWIIAAPFIFAGLSITDRTLAFFIYLVPTAMTLAWLGPVTAAIQHIVLPAMRSTASACFLLINNLIGIGFGVPFLGYLSDRMKHAHGADSLLYSITYGLGFYALAAVLLLIASRTLAKDWYRAG